MGLTFVKYVGVQLVVYAVDLGGFWLFFAIAGTDVIVANVLGKLAAGLVGFVSHKHYTFRQGDSGRAVQEALTYFTLLAIHIPVSSGLLDLLLGVLPPLPAKVLSDTICVALTFLLTRSMVFRSRA